MPKIKLFRVSGCCRGYRNYSAHSFAQQRMHRTSQLVGLNLSTGRSISLLLGTGNVAKARSIFMTFRELCRTRRLNSATRCDIPRVRRTPHACLGSRMSIDNK